MPGDTKGTFHMNETQQQIQQVELSIDDARNAISKMKCLNRLRDNKDFQELFEEDYLIQEASRVVLMKAHVSMDNPASQERLSNQIIAIGWFRNYLSTVIGYGQQAQKAIDADIETLDELRGENVE